jgi:hypothetical protein
MPNRAIDRHEDAIVFLLDLLERDNPTPAWQALKYCHVKFGIDENRLLHLTRTWVAISGVPCPALAAFDTPPRKPWEV